MKNWYLVSEGEVKKVDCGTDFDGTNEVVAYADSKDEALALAVRYDDGEITFDNVYCEFCGKAHAAVFDPSPFGAEELEAARIDLVGDGWGAQKQMAARLKAKYTTYRDWESGKSRIPGHLELAVRYLLEKHGSR